ncbi:MAG TPA: chemotaxis protein CheB [Candidatus Acidoferrales bacterium]|nr:chemotaxis protein CheB [Candidatus Acidoferrales bacterium]
MKTKSQPRRKKLHDLASEQLTASGNREGLLISAIGASAGGIEAFTELLKNLPGDTGMAFVLVQHLDPKHHSMLTELVSKQTSMPVEEVADGTKVQANHVYVIPPNATMTISNHTLQLGPRSESPAVQMTIDRFMRSLAEEQGNRAIGVILSGYGTDGTLGMAEIQAQGGVTFAQDDAKFDSMPRSVIASGCADYVLPPKGIARELARIARHPYVAKAPAAEVDLMSAADSGLGAIFQSLRRTTGVDFTQYRQTTILRRIHRRMVVHKIDKIDDYVKFVQANPAETKALYQDMLINVTSFFRNPQLFEGLKTQVFPRILKNKAPEQAIRIWTPGCASGEETYSLAIALLEFLGNRASRIPIQLFGTDVSEPGIIKARSGLFPENIQSDVSAERLRRFFTKAENTYRISKNIRDMCIFAQHNVLDDPPFSQMDTISCRNLLIYLEPPAQSRIISLFHYALRFGGFLVLGSSEGVGTSSHLFATEDRGLKIFSKKGLPARQLVTFSLNRSFERGEQAPLQPHAKPQETFNYIDSQKEFDRRLLTHYAPAAAFINEDLEIIHTRGNISRYFKLAPGRASLSILKMAREGLLMDLRNAISRAKKDNVPVRKENVLVKSGNGNGGTHSANEATRLVNFEVAPIRMGKLKEPYFMIIFEDAPPKTVQKRGHVALHEAESQSGRIVKLEQELAATKEYLQSVIETQEAMNEELQAANEEILSSNEELQSTNEELETAKEELQSANEELSTVNDELRNRNTEISQVNNDLTNLLGSIDLATVMVGSDLTIRRFTPQAQKVFGLIPADVGRPLANINPPVEIPDFEQMVIRAMSDAQTVESDVSDKAGAKYHVRIAPYRLADHKIDGAVITAMAAKEKMGT